MHLLCADDPLLDGTQALPSDVEQIGGGRSGSPGVNEGKFARVQETPQIQIGLEL